ncbi:MAG: glycoside hydrolase family 2 TIM barrel-domain containing protein [Lachnospiraceae bacterium]|nr:glycoside hydrolase family 2 TIM barrel-domain containing protein [Lachnospiraceae bacterium]
MWTVKWNEDWKVKHGVVDVFSEMAGSEESGWQNVRLPHDVMIHEKRTQNTKNGHHTGFYPGGIYTYEKIFTAPEQWRDQLVIIEFEGVYANSAVYINGNYAGGYPSGYTNFYIKANDFLKFGQVNRIRVVVNNSNESNSRWYTGSGIYRNVNLLYGDLLHISERGARLSTAEADEEGAMISVEVPVENLAARKHQFTVETQFWDSEGNSAGKAITPVTIFGGESMQIRQKIYIPKPKLWNCETPYLYNCRIQLKQGEQVLDEYGCLWGIRTLSLTPDKGLRINGKTVNLRGACIHHDNGLLGAATFERAEERRCEQLKAAGFNCIRSAHQPMSKAMLDACDRLGMLVIDELSDVWTRSKNDNDYARDFPMYWKTDVERMVDKDFNHVCVIIYSTGNEIIEVNTAMGAHLNREIANRIKSLDCTRYTTTAINGMLAAAGEIRNILSDVLKGNDSFNLGSDTGTGGGIDTLNKMLSLMKGSVEDAFAAHPIMTNLIEETSGALDICGLNYLTGRHVLEHELDANRIVLGMETYPADIARLWGLVESQPHVIGDMTWTGYDYIGESGCGIFYYDGRMGFGENWPASLSYIGDIDIIGNRRPISYYREIIYGLRRKPCIAIQRLNHYGEIPSKTSWMFSDSLTSWTWTGYEGKSAVVEVYSDAEEVELFLNGKSLGKKPAGPENQYLAIYEIAYEPGRLEAMNIRNGQAAETEALITASGNRTLHAEADKVVLNANGSDLSYIMVSCKGENGVTDLQVQKEIHISVEGCAELAGFGSADPETENHYDSQTWKTYDGYLLAIIRAGNTPGGVQVSFTSTDGLKTSLKIQVV